MHQWIFIVVSMLIAVGIAKANPLDDGLRNAAGKCDPELVELLIQKGANVNSSINSSDGSHPPCGMSEIVTPLNYAMCRAYYHYDRSSISPAYSRDYEAGEQCKKVVLLLLSHKADPNLPGSNAFSIALPSGNIDLVKILLSNGLNPDILNTPIDYAFSRRPLMGTPLMAVINKDVHDSSGKWPSYQATVFSLVLSKSTNVNQQNSDSKTVLMIAAGKGLEEIVQKLVNAGANKALKDKEGHTALDYAIIGGHMKVIKILQK